MQNLVPILYYVYALILFGGGLMGFRAGSVPSLIGSSVFAAVAVTAALLCKNNPRMGLIIGLINAVAVTGFFIYRYISTQKPFPAFPAIGISVIVLILTGIALAGLAKEPGA